MWLFNTCTVSLFVFQNVKHKDIKTRLKKNKKKLLMLILFCFYLKFNSTNIVK